MQEKEESAIAKLTRTGRADAGKYFAEVDDLRYRPHWGSLIAPASVVGGSDQITREQAIKFFTESFD